MADNVVQTLIEQIGKHWGWEVGDKVRQEINAVVSAQDVDIDQLQAAIQTIQQLLDADPDTEEFDVGQNIVTQLSDHLARITSLESDMATLKGDATTVGSVAYAVKQERDRATATEAGLQSDIETLNGDETVEGSVAKKVKDAVDSEAAARQSADANLQSQIDDLTGGAEGSIASVQSEVDAIETGAGLNDNGSYTAKSDANYIADATSLKDADDKLDAAIKSTSDATATAQAKADANEAAINTLNGDETVEGSVAKAAKAAHDSAVADAQAYADATFVSKQQIANISAATLASIFRQALDCGFDGKPKDDVLNGTGDCATASGDDGGDGAVI
ncbi:hypothetical protein [Nitratifractor salsuginis]|uniref:Uncharacterized protein n=1 Tax=Nitratifractor salsuginis (strain DSM 16511 / JCM 12458 / E9I37-1) TaxID=749222 RepID=E6WY49_NITSE|nr:hypothetical protein [Nitratifractor salsuginis]ADV46423.1 hypothetical protein Nitsa_1170 [Nitratifractor salsuginis DSM 16511]